MVYWENYAKVLSELSKHYHVYAIDCHGHGGSSKNPEKYTAVSMGKDFIWFIENIIKEPVVISDAKFLGKWLGKNCNASSREIYDKTPWKRTSPVVFTTFYDGSWFKGFDQQKPNLLYKSLAVSFLKGTTFIK